MSVIKGKIIRVDSRDTAYGMMYNAVVSTAAGEETLGFGKFHPKAANGDFIEVGFTLKGRYKNADYKTLKVVEEPSGFASATPAPPAGRAYSGSYGGGDDKRQTIISKQAARNSAIATFAAISVAGYLPISASGKVGDKYDMCVALIDSLTDKYYNYSIGAKESSEEDDNDDAAGEPFDSPY